MTVGELKKELEGVNDNIRVIVTYDGGCGRTDEVGVCLDLDSAGHYYCEEEGHAYLYIDAQD